MRVLIVETVGKDERYDGDKASGNTGPAGELIVTIAGVGVAIYAPGAWTKGYYVEEEKP